MRLDQEMRRLRAEHAALTTLSQIMTKIVRAPDPPRPTELLAVRAMLRDTLLRHLKCEDWVLYPRLKTSGDPELIAMAREFVAEMGHIAGDFAAYDERWTTERVQDEWAGFRSETLAILGALATRIAREEGELYPVAEKLEAAPLPIPVRSPVRGGSLFSN